MSREHILVVDDSKVITMKLSAMLSKLDYKVTVKLDPFEAIKWMRVPGNYPDLIISDITMPGMNGYDLVRQIRSDPILNRTPVILLTGNTEMEDKVAGFEAGADDYLEKTISPTELELRVRALLKRIQKTPVIQPVSEAKIVSVFSLRGGVGTTSMAVNLATAVSQLWGTETALLDMSLKNGHCSLMLNLKPKYTMAYLAGWEDPTIDPETIEGVLLRHESGVRLLPAPVSPAEAELITLTEIDRVWPYIRATFPMVVIDAGSQFVEPVLTILERSHYIVLMIAPELASLKAAVDATNIFTQIGIDPQKIVPVVNWIFPNQGLPQKNIEAALKHKISTVVPYESSTFIQAINTGKPVFMTNPASQASLSIATLAYNLSTTEMEARGIAYQSELLSWVRKLARAA